MAFEGHCIKHMYISLLSRNVQGENTRRGALLHGVPYGVPKMEYP